MKKTGEKLFMAAASVWGMIRILFVHPRVIVFGTDMIGGHRYDPRMARIYEWLESHHISYANLVYANPRGQVIHHWLRRTKPVVYARGLPWEWFLRFADIQQLWAIDDYRRWPRVVAAARRAGMKSILFQHGRFTHHQKFPTDMLPTQYILWNDYWRRKLTEVSPFFQERAAVLRVGGKPSKDTPVFQGEHPASQEKLRIMLIHEPAAPSDQVRALIRRLVSIERVQLIYKVRGDQLVPQQLHQHGLTPELLEGHTIITPTIIPCDLALGSYSTLLYELIAAEVPVGVLKISSLQADDLVQDDLATYVDPYAPDLLIELDRVVQVNPGELKHRADQMRVSIPIEETLEHLLNVRH